MQIKSATRYHLTRIGMAIITTFTSVSAGKKFPNNECWKGRGEKGTLLCCWWECKLTQPVWRTVGRFPKKLKVDYIWPSNPTPGHMPRENPNSKTCTPKFIAMLFTITRTGKQRQCPSMEGWIKKMRHIYTMEYHSATKRNEIGSFVEMWMDIETVTLSEVSQKEKNKYWILTHICGIWKKMVQRILFTKQN